MTDLKQACLASEAFSVITGIDLNKSNLTLGPPTPRRGLALALIDPQSRVIDTRAKFIQ